jgi:hypothetical protein
MTHSYSFDWALILRLFLTFESAINHCAFPYNTSFAFLESHGFLLNPRYPNSSALENASNASLATILSSLENGF